MKKFRKLAKLRRFKDRIKHPHYYRPFLRISSEDLSEEGLANLFAYCCAICNTNNIAVGIGNFKNGRAPVYVMKR